LKQIESITIKYTDGTIESIVSMIQSDTVEGKCVGCGKMTKYTYNLFGGDNKLFLPLCKKCQKLTVDEMKKQKKRDMIANARKNIGKKNKEETIH